MNTLINSFHHTSIRVRDAKATIAVLEKLDAELTKSERNHARRVRDVLCGAWRSHPKGSGCACGVVSSVEET